MKGLKPKKVRIDNILFDSALEARAYVLLCQVFRRDQIKVKPVLSLKSETYGHFVPAFAHKVDFGIQINQYETIYLEIKGTLKGSWNGRMEYIKLLPKLLMVLDSSYIIWTGDGSTGFDGMEEMPFCRKIPSNPSEVRNALRGWHDSRF